MDNKEGFVLGSPFLSPSVNSDCDGTDASRFKQDFGRSTFSNPCPVCVSGGAWCGY